MSDSAFVVGMGEVGRRLAGALGSAGWVVRPVRRDEGWDDLLASAGGTVLVCVREDALPSVLPRLAAVAPGRLAFVQNGWIRPLLDDLPGHTRGLVWFTSKGETFEVLRPSLFRGPRAAALCAALAAAGIPAQALDEQAFAGAEAEKMGFNCLVGLPLALRGLALGDYLARHAAEAEQLFHESVDTCAQALGVPADPGWWAAFVAAVRPILGVRATAAKALEYRNGAVLRLARGLGREVPVTAGLLRAAGWRG